MLKFIVFESLGSELKCIGRWRRDHHPCPGRLHIAADRVEAISYYATSHAMTADGHGRKNAPAVSRWIVRFKCVISSMLEKVLILSSGDVDAAFVDADV